MPDTAITPSCKNCGNLVVVKTTLSSAVTYARCAACGALWVTSWSPSGEREWDVTNTDPDSSTVVLTIRTHL
jgi:uncharacterized Zn finger protein